MIIIKLQGGLGNQLFQWAYAKSISIDLKTDLYLDLSFLNKIIPGITKREYELHYFKKILDKPIPDELKLDNIQYINDNNYVFQYKDIEYKPEYNYYLDGYFQNYKYLIKHKYFIQESLQPDYSLLNNCSDLISQIITTNSVSLHVRRTDYVKHSIHPVQDINYYHNAISYLKNYDYVFVFSDDIKWCKENLKFNNMVFVENLLNIQDLWLMSLCKNNIIANSSFSWWAAWLNENIDNVVICPNQWIRGVDANSFVPSDWIKI